MQLNRSVIGVMGYQGQIARPMFRQLSICGAQVIGLSETVDDLDEQTRIDVMSEGARFVHTTTRTPLDGLWRGDQIADWGLVIISHGKDSKDRNLVDSKELQHFLALGCDKLMLVTVGRSNHNEISDLAFEAGTDFLSIALLENGSSGSCLESPSAAKNISAATEIFFKTSGIAAPSELLISC